MFLCPRPTCPNQNASEKSIENRSKRRSPSIISAGAIATATTEGECIARAALERRVESLERDLLRAGQERRVQSDRAASLRRKLAATVTADDRGERAGGSAGGHGRREETETADILALKSKVIQLVERLRQEKTARLKAERETQGVAEKVSRCISWSKSRFWNFMGMVQHGRNCIYLRQNAAGRRFVV